MSFTKYLQQTFQQEIKGVKGKDYNYKKLHQQRLIDFRKEKSSVVRVQKPTNLARARSLGYKAKQGFVVVRVRVRKGSGLHRRPIKGRRPKRMGVTKLTRRHSIRSIAEKRASRKYPNCEVLNSYKLGEDGLRHYHEVILVDSGHPVIRKDRKLKWLAKKTHRGRAHRGLTSAGKKSRGLRSRRRKGKGSEKARPSVRAKDRKAK